MVLGDGQIQVNTGKLVNPRLAVGPVPHTWLGFGVSLKTDVHMVGRILDGKRQLMRDV